MVSRSADRRTDNIPENRYIALMSSYLIEDKLELASELFAECKPLCSAGYKLYRSATIIQGDVLADSYAGWEKTLYRVQPSSREACKLTAIPYYAWDNRQASAMCIWLRV